jgi:hypothetical protein
MFFKGKDKENFKEVNIEKKLKIVHLYINFFKLLNTKNLYFFTTNLYLITLICVFRVC